MTSKTSANETILLEKLAEYGRSGAFSLVETICDRLQNVVDSHKSCRIPFDISSTVLNQCIRVIEQCNEADYRRAAWNMLFFMCDRQRNALAWDLLNEVESTTIPNLVSKTIASLSSETEPEVNSCLQFLFCFATSNGHRPALLGHTEGLLETVLLALDTKFEYLQVEVKSTLLRALTTVLPNQYSVLSEAFLRHDGFRIVNKIFHYVYQVALNNKPPRGTVLCEEDQGLLNGCISSLHTLFIACCGVDLAGTDVPKSMYSYDPVGLIKITSALHDFFTLSEDPVFEQISITLIRGFLLFVEGLHPESLEFVLLYRGKKLSPTTYSGKPMIIHAILLTRCPHHQHTAEILRDVIPYYSSRFLTAEKMFRDNLPVEPVVVPANGPLPKVCALPNCFISSLHGVSLMKRCSRCRAVHYCGEHHQKKHWPEHKLVCVRKK